MQATFDLNSFTKRRNNAKGPLAALTQAVAPTVQPKPYAQTPYAQTLAAIGPQTVTQAAKAAQAKKEENTLTKLFGQSGQKNNSSSWTNPFASGVASTGVGLSGLSGVGLSGASTGSTVGRIFGYIFAVAIVIFIILLFVHYFIIPVFRLQPGAPGIIPVPGFDDGKLFWDKTNPGQILNRDLPIATLYHSYTLNLDIFIQNPFQFSKNPRILLSRGKVKKPTSNTLLGIIDNYNLVIALLPDTNDILVSVLNKDSNMENAIIRNVPIQESFRISVVVMEVALEVYLNGRLIKTRQFRAPPKDVKSDIYPSSGIEKNIAKLRNLKIWARTLTISEIRNSNPSLSSNSDFGAEPMPGTSTCLMDSMSDIKSNASDAFEKIEKEKEEKEKEPN